MSKTTLPRFVIYQPNEKEFHICLEAGGVFLRWCSYYAPTLDVHFPREVTRIEDLPLKNKPRKQIYDEGTYALTQSKSAGKEAIEQKVAEGIQNKSFSFILNGKTLHGRFAFKRSGKITVLQKFKDKYAKEEDVLSGDLARTIKTMVPDYDESKVTLNYPPKAKRKVAYKPKVETEEEVTADKKIGSTSYHFAFYTSGSEPEICLVTSANGEVIVLKKLRDQWTVQTSAKQSVLKNTTGFTAHASALYGRPSKSRF